LEKAIRIRKLLTNHKSGTATLKKKAFNTMLQSRAHAQEKGVWAKGETG